MLLKQHEIILFFTCIHYQFSTKEQIKKTYTTAEMNTINRMIQTDVTFYEITLIYINLYNNYFKCIFIQAEGVEKENYTKYPSWNTQANPWMNTLTD